MPTTGDASGSKGVFQELVRGRWVFLLFHLSLGAYCAGVTLRPIATLMVWLMMQVGIHAGHHRYFAHRSFRTYPWFEFVLGAAGCLALQNGPIWWSAKHRIHHLHADTELDNHSPSKSFWHSHIGWLLADGVGDIEWHYVSDLRRPIPLWIESHQDWIHGLYVMTILLLGGWQSLLNCWVLPIVICWHTTFSTNSFCHVLGTRPHKCQPGAVCNARNNLLVAIINLGEGWHNNHHANPSLGHHGYYRWYQIDIVYTVLLAWEWLGLIWQLKRRRQGHRDQVNSRLSRLLTRPRRVLRAVVSPFSGRPWRDPQ
jgi:stearoyl-CoA desaturase (delta-9 desaturase)